MARLPTADDLGYTAPRSQRTVNSYDVSRPLGPNLDVQDLAAEDRGGQMLQQGGAKLSDLYRVEMDKIDTLKAEDALNKIKQARLDMTMGEQGAYQVKGGNVLTPDYMSGYKSKFDATVEGISSSLTPQQRAKLKPHADHEGMGMQSDILRHSMSESERYKGIVREGTLSTATNAGVMKWADPVGFEKEKTLIASVVDESAKSQGINDPDTLLAMRAKAMSPMLSGAIVAALDARDTKRAESLLNDNAIHMDAGAVLKANEHITKLKEDETVRGVAAEEIAQAATKNTPIGKLGLSLTQAIGKAESGNSHLAKDGSVILGPMVQKGANAGDRAVGRFQIMPKTAPDDARAAGIPWDEKLFYSPTPAGAAYHEKLHEGHLTRLTRMGFTDPIEIAAAYNAGEGNVLKAKKAFANAQKLMALGQSPVLPGGYNPEKDGELSFLDFLPKPSETKPYVSRVADAMKNTPDIVRPSIADVESRMAAKFPGRPDLAKSAVDIVKHQFTTQDEARKVEIDKIKESAYSYMAQGKGFEELPPSLVAKLPAEERMKMKDAFASYLSKKDRDSNQGLLGQINNDPTYLQRQDNATWNGPMRSQLSEYDWKRFDTQRSAKLGGNVKEAETLNEGAINQRLATRLRNLEIDPTPKDNDAEGLARINSARLMIDQSVLAEQKRLGKALTDVELGKHIDSLFFHDVKFRNTFLGVTYGDVQGVSVLAMAPGDIPSADKDRIEAELKKAGIAKPNNTQILTRYKQLKMGASGGR